MARACKFERVNTLEKPHHPPDKVNAVDSTESSATHSTRWTFFFIPIANISMCSDYFSLGTRDWLDGTWYVEKKTQPNKQHFFVCRSLKYLCGWCLPFKSIAETAERNYLFIRHNIFVINIMKHRTWFVFFPLSPSRTFLLLSCNKSRSH